MAMAVSLSEHEEEQQLKKLEKQLLCNESDSHDCDDKFTKLNLFISPGQAYKRQRKDLGIKARYTCGVVMYVLRSVTV